MKEQNKNAKLYKSRAKFNEVRKNRAQTVILWKQVKTRENT